MGRIWILICLMGTACTYSAPRRGMAPHAIMCFCKPAVRLASELSDASELKVDVGNMSERILDAQIRKYTTQGVIATYQGYVAFSDHNGELLFPRKHTRDALYCIVTRSIKPEFGQGKIVNNFRITKPEQTRMYYLERIQKEDQEKPEWHVQELAIENEMDIPTASITIFSNPEHIIIPTGTFTTIEGGSLLLPDIYVKKSIPIGPNALAFLRINRYFAPVTNVYAYTADRYATGMRP